MADLAATLRREMAGDVRDDAYTRHLFAADASLFAIEPVAVAFPRDADDVAAAVTIAARFGVPIVPRGGGTSLAGQTAGGRGLVIDTSRHMNAIDEVDADARRVRVGPGVVQEDLNRAAHRFGLGFGPDTSTSNRATIGGMIGNNSSGSESIVHGTTVDHVLALDVVLADGTQATFAEGSTHRLDAGVKAILRAHARAIAEDYPRHWRQSGGYRLDRLDPFNLAKLIAGSEGTLAIITAATVRLVPLPKAKMFAVGHFDSLLGAIEATGAALALGPSAVELIGRTILDLSRAQLAYRALADRLEGDPEALLFVSFSGDTEDEVRAKLDALEWDAYHTLRAETAADQKALTDVRKAGLGLLMAASEGRTRPAAFVEDTAVAPELLPEYVARFREILAARGLKAGFYGHCSVGCLHIRPFLDLSRDLDTLRDVAEEVVALVAEYDGVNSSEHGDGRVRSPFNPRIFGDELYGAMREVKRLFDPDNRLNPGVMVDAEPLGAHVRDAELPQPRPLETHFRFPEGSMFGAADRCQRIGICRKTGAGVMCPSYMATREEEHATRGRANALVKALSQPDPHAALGDDRLHEILDLCLECKACKSECPLTVDMASLKAEALAHRHALHGTPLRSRLFGAIRTLNRIGAATAPLSNLPAPVRLLGITNRRPRPRFERETLLRWDRGRPTPTQADVIFLADSFTTFTDAGVGRAAIELLEAAGYGVRVESGGCCGRASISKGLLDDARAKAEDLTRRLGGDAPITGVEPSCLLTLREEHVQLLGNGPSMAPRDSLTARDRGVAPRVTLVEELLLDADIPFVDRGPCRILFHGHCHQKALAGTAATVALLKRIPGAEVIELDAGCCGMAGSFGYEAEHYELSMRIGAMRLFPAVRREPAETLIAATGFSCRQQIEHGTGRRARHPVEIVAGYVAGTSEHAASGVATRNVKLSSR